MTLWTFLLCVVCGIAAALFLTRSASSRLPQKARRKRLRYLKPYEPPPPASRKGPACD